MINKQEMLSLCTDAVTFTDLFAKSHCLFRMVPSVQIGKKKRKKKQKATAAATKTSLYFRKPLICHMTRALRNLSSPFSCLLFQLQAGSTHPWDRKAKSKRK